LTVYRFAIKKRPLGQRRGRSFVLEKRSETEPSTTNPRRADFASFFQQQSLHPSGK